MNDQTLPQSAPTPDQLVVLDAAEAIKRLAAQLGSYRRLIRITRNLAASEGQEA